MSRRFVSILWLITAILFLFTEPALAQNGRGTVTGTVTDADHDILPGAPVKLIQGNVSVLTNSVGEFIATNLEPGSYTVAVSYLGFATENKEVTVAAGQVLNVNFVLQVATQNDQVVVTAGRSYGEVEAVNEMRASDTIVNILPANVIASLPNANVADAVGRLPGVTLERDEGEGKYVQIRGTEPRLSNLTVDGVILPSPESLYRQVKLDTIPAGIIESVQVEKTFQANMDGDAIGGTVNLVTKVAQERPTISLYGAGGFTPIINTVPVAEFGGTVGQRFGHDKRIGAIISGAYDYNGRGIDDFESNAPLDASYGTLTPYYYSAVIRQYKYDRTRYGFGGSVDYKLSDTSLIYVRGLYSEFKDYGHRWEYTLTTNNPNMQGSPSITTERRTGDFLVSSLLVGGNHVFTKSWINWGVSAARSRMFNPINNGESITDFVPSPNFPATSNCQYDAAATKNKFTPQFTSACFTEGYNPDNFQLDIVSQSNHGKSAQVNLAAFASVARNYQLGAHASTFEFGFKIRNAHKFDDSYTNDYQHNANLMVPTAAPVLESSFLGGFSNPNYYGGAYRFAPNSASWELGNAYLATHPGDFTLTSTKGGNGGNYDLVELVTAGYIMNTIDFSRFRLIAGLRIEGTNDTTYSFDGGIGGTGTLSIKGGGSYVSFLPSASLRYRLDNSSDIRAIYSRTLNRPDPQFLTQSFIVDCGSSPCLVTKGNNTLRAEYSNNYDLLYERYLTPFGLFQAGFFYKGLSSPVVTVQVAGTAATCPPNLPPPPVIPPCLINTPVNAGSGYITGFETSFIYHFTRLPRLLSGLGVSANYSYAASKAYNVNPGNRTDSPALLRQAPNTWNISPTYDRGRLSVRLGLAYNQANIAVYNWTNTNTCGLTINAPAGATFDPVAGGIKGPCGDQYFYSHFQVDLQGSYRIHRGLYFTAAGLNLNNEVFGFYYGSPQFVTQREYYKPTYTFGMRWSPVKE